MKLALPSLEYEKSFTEALKEMRATEGMLFWEEVGSPKSVKDYIQLRLDHSKGKHLPPGWIPATTYWLIDSDTFVGETTIRHELTEHLMNVGGHIGYWIRPSERKKGWGTKILQMALEKAKGLGIQQVRVTCDETNTASRKIIEVNGGKLDGVTDMGEKLPRKLLFWISLS
jgi:predicted acetyltransferase